jgi:mannitol-1-phosphate 5-dehydrogenase
MGKRFVGFGFGPIQTGLMLHEAAESGSFEDFAVSEVDRTLVEAVRRNSHSVTINIAGKNGIHTRILTGIRIFDPGNEADREEIGRAVREADEMATAVPSVSIYGTGGQASIAAFLAANAAAEKPAILYAAENHNFAAEILKEELEKRAPPERLSRLQILNTVIGKMSGVISSPEEMRSVGLAPLVPGFNRCVLVEEFNRILISRITLPGFRRGIRVFEEKDDLLPFEEAKLYGHNAVHALLGCLAWTRGYAVMSEIREDRELFALGERAFIEESGAALVRKHGATGDPLFTNDGYHRYAEDLLERMTNPYLHDKVERIIRDPERKLGYSDRLVGTMREALRQGVEPRIMAMGAAAALLYVRERDSGRSSAPAASAVKPPASEIRRRLLALWSAEPADEHRETCISMIQKAMELIECRPAPGRE